MSSPSTSTKVGPEDRPGAGPELDQPQSRPSRANPISRVRIATRGCLVRHPALLTVLEWFGWNAPGASSAP
jgi:hypothetical protein